MKEYRKTLDLDSEKSYTYVSMGPIPGQPPWHQELYAEQTYPFPTEDAALTFARTHKAKDPGREVVIEYPDGHRWNWKEWM